MGAWVVGAGALFGDSTPRLPKQSPLHNFETFILADGANIYYFFLIKVFQKVPENALLSKYLPAVQRVRPKRSFTCFGRKKINLINRKKVEKKFETFFRVIVLFRRII